MSFLAVTVITAKNQHNQRKAKLPLLLSNEDEQSDKTFKNAGIFSEATICPQVTKNHAETIQEALEISLNKNMKVDLPYMAKIYRKDRI
ncbi:hypothetical protein KDN24_18935, partial [Bacillus sp. Bva_UNVM-123]|uniref:hypothetical protein n=1 Tax=Bacillus sp. Bva_UNVM-123 TaxID=2829798 RepID=UPI00391FC340